ncbi:MAG: phosphoglucosamine mutase [Bacteroidetes bacterium]|jgi:phosphomannomutase|nr:phosphoglucosamine mutase [Bacteroidota bacterium]MBT4401701.1 phosphoglucosamine mutase [Bacteroidota bacterium]MBT4411443.1 phosphoglucosamine mutase [Bacteroidota bacterium]MBT5427159.1 phosphoglucosamine mutase [Bacteroidota bacterium]MBT7464350.1 phosphoglucosamine mutase [Bacteroidota bacterium]
MTLIKSISGIRGTIGGLSGTALTPPDIISFASAYGAWVMEQAAPQNGKRYRLIVGRDARISGMVVDALVCNTLLCLGIDVINAGLATTPTVEMAVTMEDADGGIILTASHNPKQWNALKLLNAKGEFLSGEDGVRILELTGASDIEYASVDNLGQLENKDFLNRHIQSILDLELVQAALVKKSGFKVVVDAVNSVGGIAIPAMLKALGVSEIIPLNCDPTGEFAHNPEPLPEHLHEIRDAVVKHKADLGVIVDPDVDRLALVNPDGSFFGEEYTLVAVSDYILSNNKGATVSNLSSSRALRDLTRKHKCEYAASAVGEVNVVEKMKSLRAVIGGEGNGGIIYPELHYGRDALVGIALFLSHMAISKKSALELRSEYPVYYMSKNKIQLTEGKDPDDVLSQVLARYENNDPITIDGVKIDFEDSWVHLRKSNTEPIIRIYSEAKSADEAETLAKRFMKEMS